MQENSIYHNSCKEDILFKQTRANLGLLNNVLSTMWRMYSRLQDHERQIGQEVEFISMSLKDAIFTGY